MVISPYGCMLGDVAMDKWIVGGSLGTVVIMLPQVIRHHTLLRELQNSYCGSGPNLSEIGCINIHCIECYIMAAAVAVLITYLTSRLIQLLAFHHSFITSWRLPSITR